MVRVIWFDLADKPDVSTGRGRLLVVIHHLVVDGVSWRILVTDLASVTAQLQAGVTPELPQIGTSFRRWEHGLRSEEHTSELQSLMRISYAVFCLKKKNNKRYR